MTDAVVFDRVSFSYPGAPQRALQDVACALAEGSFVLVAGPTGAGKSTFLRAINGLVPHFSGGTFSGRVEVMGRATLENPPRVLADVVAFVPQDPAAVFVLDVVEDELAYALENLGIERGSMRRRVEETLDLLGIEQLRARPVASLSGGERQRVAIGAAMATNPKVLVLDEPTSQLDPQGAEDVLAALQRLVHDHGLTVVIAEHRLERVAGFADVVVACRGRGEVTVDDPRMALALLDAGPPVARLGRALGWSPPPLTVREARWRAAHLVLAPARPGTAPSCGEVLIEARGIEAAYGAATVLRRIDVALRAGEVVALMGRNGAGKTTLLRCLAGLHAPQRGTVKGPDTAPPRTGVDVALCPQEPEVVLFRDTVTEEIETTVRAHPGAGDRHSIAAAFGLTALAGRHPRDLSAGERLLVAVAAVAATGAPVLLLDEPTRGLDPASKARLAAGLEAHARRGGVALFATHDVELAAAVASRVVLVASGEVIADGPPEDVLGDSAVFAPQMTRVFGPGWLTPEQVLEALR